MYFNVVHIKNDTDTGETNGFLSLKCASYREFPTSQSILALGLGVPSHRHDGMKNWLPAFVLQPLPACMLAGVVACVRACLRT